MLKKSVFIPTSYVVCAAITIVGCGGAQDITAQRKMTQEEIDAALTAGIVGTWAIDSYASEGDYIGDGKSREIDVWTFRPDGTWSSRLSNNARGTLGTFAQELITNSLGMTMEGRWWIHDSYLHVEFTSSPNPVTHVGIKAYGGELVNSGRITEWSESGFHAGDTIYHRFAE